MIVDEVSHSCTFLNEIPKVFTQYKAIVYNIGFDAHSLRVSYIEDYRVVITNLEKKASHITSKKYIDAPPIKLVIRNTSIFYPDESVYDELKEKRFTITAVSRMRNRQSKNSCP